MPRIQMIRQKRPAAPSEFYSCGVLPGPEMYPNTTWLDTKGSRCKNLLQNLLRNFEPALILSSKNGFHFTVIPYVLIAREVNSFDRFHHGFRFISPNTSLFPRNGQLPIFGGKSRPSIALGWSDKHRTLFGTNRHKRIVSLRDIGNLEKPEMNWTLRQHAITVRTKFVSDDIIRVLLSLKKIYLTFIILDTCIKSRFCSRVSNHKFQIIVDTHF